MYQLITLICAAVFAAAMVYVYKTNTKAGTWTIKIATIVFMSLGFLRFFLPDGFLNVINGAWVSQVRFESTDYLNLVLRWGYYTSYAVIPMAVFTKSRLFKNAAGYFSAVFAVLVTVFFGDFMEYFLMERTVVVSGYQLTVSEAFRYVQFIAELALAIAIPVALHINEKHVFNVKSLSEWRNFLLGIPGILIAMMPVYAPQAILGYDVFIPAKFSNYHLIWLAVAFVITLAMYYLFRFKSYDTRYNLCLFLTIVLFFHYNSFYLSGVTIKRLPFQLCNIAAYFYMIAVPLKLKKMMHFCFLANVVGTLFAMLLPDFSRGNFSFANTHFIWEHTIVLLIPALAMGLRVFPRVNLKSLKYYFVGFTAYFLFSFVVGTILNGYADVTGQTVNYFFMFDLKMAFDYFPFLKFTENYHLTFGRFEAYPLVVSIIYVGFSILNGLFYLLVRALYKFEDDHLDLRRSRIDLYEKITGKVSRSPKNFIDKGCISDVRDN